MALANFLDKAALQASQILTGYDRERFEGILTRHRILLSFDNSCLDSPEASAALNLSVRLLARLYPFFTVEGDPAVAAALMGLAREINPVIETFDPLAATVAVVLGNTPVTECIPAFYIGSDGWTAKCSAARPVKSGKSNNPFGAGAAACWGAANVFRFIFRDQLPHGPCDSQIEYSLLEGSSPTASSQTPIPDLVMPDTVLAGLGAIGNGFVWALQRVNVLTGSLVLVDHEKIDLTNLQRYVLALQNHVGRKKVHIAGNYLDSGICPHPEPFTLEEYIQYRGNWQISRLLTAVDNPTDRIMAQGILPKTILNAWTQAENLGISRHLDFINDPCLCCLYTPSGAARNYSEEVATQLGITELEREVRMYLATHRPVDEALIGKIAVANNIDPIRLLPFAGSPLSVFYSKVVCGGVLMALQPTSAMGYGEAMQVPAAFESALAGVLLAAECVRQAMGINGASLTTQFNMMRPFSPYVHLTADKKTSCICQDPVYRAVYRRKWPTTKSTTLK